MPSSFIITDASVNDSACFVQEILTPSQQVAFAFANGVSNVCIFLEPLDGNIPRNKPLALKTEIDSILGLNAPVNIRFARSGKLLLETSDGACAQAIAEINKILNVPVKASIKQETITSRFVLHNIDTSVRLEDLGKEIQAENPVKVKELRRFTKKENSSTHPTETVLVTIYGTALPSRIKFFYMIEKIRPFYDRPRQCLNCWQFDHATVHCKNETKCRKCGAKHASATCSTTDLKCSNCQAPHLASDQNCPARSKEMDFLKYKTDNHLSITEARRRYTKSSKSKNYAEVVKDAEPGPTSTYITKDDFQKSMELYLQRTQECILQVLQQQTNIFLKAIEGLVPTLMAACAVKSQKTSSSKETSVTSPSKVSQKVKKQKVTTQLSLDNSNVSYVQESVQLCGNMFASSQSSVDDPGDAGMD